jgi:hypothetical protein
MEMDARCVICSSMAGGMVVVHKREKSTEYTLISEGACRGCAVLLCVQRGVGDIRVEG